MPKGVFIRCKSQNAQPSPSLRAAAQRDAPAQHPLPALCLPLSFPPCRRAVLGAMRRCAGQAGEAQVAPGWRAGSA